MPVDMETLGSRPSVLGLHGLEPEPVQLPHLSDVGVLNQEQQRRWRQQGWLFLEGIWPDSLVEQCCAELLSEFPTAAPVGGAGAGYGGGEHSFPNRGQPTLNEITLHDRSWSLAAHLLGSDDLRLGHATLRPCWGAARPDMADIPLGEVGSDEWRQAFADESLLTPPPLTDCSRPEAVHMRVYLCDYEPGTAADMIADPGTGLEESEWPRSLAGAVSTAQVPPVGKARALNYKKGAVLVYRSELHLRVASLVPLQRRIVQSIAIRRANAPWIKATGFGVTVSGMDRSWIPSLTVQQRNRLGFPAPGNDYWTPDTIQAVSHHYAGPASGWNGPEGIVPTPMDMSEYVAAMSLEAANSKPTLGPSSAPAATPSSLDERGLLPAVPGRWSFRGEEMLWAAATRARPEGGAGDDVLSTAQVCLLDCPHHPLPPSFSLALRSGENNRGVQRRGNSHRKGREPARPCSGTGV